MTSNNLFVQEWQTFSMIAGDHRELDFEINDGETGEPVNLTDFKSIRWILFRYGNPEYPLLNLKGTVNNIDNHTFYVDLLSTYTENLEGLFIHQINLTDSADKTFIPVQGQINIIPKGIGENSVIIN